jgi:hypothetical protein
LQYWAHLHVVWHDIYGAGHFLLWSSPLVQLVLYLLYCRPFGRLLEGLQRQQEDEEQQQQEERGMYENP